MLAAESGKAAREGGGGDLWCRRLVLWAEAWPARHRRSHPLTRVSAPLCSLPLRLDGQEVFFVLDLDLTGLLEHELRFGLDDRLLLLLLPPFSLSLLLVALGPEGVLLCLVVLGALLQIKLKE